MSNNWKREQWVKKEIQRLNKENNLTVPQIIRMNSTEYFYDLRLQAEGNYDEINK